MIKKIRVVNSKQILILFVLIEHLLFFYFNNIINRNNLIDPVQFFTRGITLETSGKILQNIYPGTTFMYVIIMLLIRVCNNFFIISLIFSLFCFLPYYWLINKYYESVVKNSIFLKITFLLLLFMPSIHFWMTSIYKEALLFPLIYLFLNRVSYNRNNILKIDAVIYLLLIFFIRPYLVGILLLAFAIVNYKVFNKKKVFAVFFAAMGFFILFWRTLLPDVDVFSLKSKISELNNFSKLTGNSVIDIEKTTYFERLIYMLFRPLFFDAKNNSQLIYSIENLFFAVWVLVILFVFFKNKIKVNVLFQNIYTVTSILVWFFIGIYIYNYGLASRMKVMIVPFFLIGIIDIMKNRFNEENN